MTKKKSPMEGGKAPELKPKKADDEKQGDLIDVDHPQDKPLIASARKIRRLDKERGEIQDKADAERENLKELMHERKYDHYKFGDIEITIKSNEKVSVKLAEISDGGSSGESED